ncbi:polysaccharide deacetylase [Grimontia hollisae]|uniref:Polysaccharide deacetylase n=2 Tax=Grimontia hollisae TaxID=673 RepID=D0I3Z1_GRIHO|nr:polysaccharide deacetylase [Grimontia hollisae]EEY73769.1 polysaccharide deacetylase [Grimontia hollisae CIP 101886]STO41965.1 Maltose O-acetyltransferase [Grimontia hollisae]STO55889.1 Maltose O-acetyltransferase [Grimontia hollisae]
MNILMALSQLEVTGAEVYATTVGNTLTQRGHNVFYVSDTLTKPHDGPYFKLRFNKRSIPRRFWHVAYLVYLIKKHNIQMVHAHSRASSWSCHVACKLTGTPMVTTVHGRQPVHASRKKFHAMGNKAMPVCEAIYHQLIDDLNVPQETLEVSRNGIDTHSYQWLAPPQNTRKVIAIIGRLSGPKGDLCYRLLEECLDLDKYDVKIVTGTQPDARFDKFKAKADFVGYVEDVPAIMARADLVIGAGRVAMESLLCGRPTMAIGEALNIGPVTQENLQQAMATNFGDIGKKELDIDFSVIPAQIEAALSAPHCDPQVSEKIKQSYDLQNIVSHLETIYQSVYVYTKRKDIPVLMYHRFINSDDGKGTIGPYLDIRMFEKHLKLLKRLGFETLTFSDLKEHGVISRLKAGKRYCIITVDDGFKDNYTLMLPLLKKYNFKAVVYAVTGVDFNKWDVEHPESPEKRFELMTPSEIKAMADSGYIEIGGHTLTHPHLNTLSREEQKAEIMENKAQLETLLGKELVSFAYPYGDWNEDSKALAKEAGYQFAVATNSGPVAFHEDPYLIRRIGIFPGTDVLSLARKITGGYLFRKLTPKKNVFTHLVFKVRNSVKIAKGNTIKFGVKNRIRKCTIAIHGRGNRLIFEDGANLKGVHIELDGNHCTMIIGKHCVIGEGCYFSARENNTTLRIGDHCMFSRNVKLMTSDGHDIHTLEQEKRINSAKNITIGNRVWLADSAVVLKGCTIGDGAVVGINAVVTKNVPNNSIAAGNPAKVIKNNIRWNEELTY